VPISSSHPKTIRELINDVSFQFAESDIYYGHGTDNAFDEAVYLIFSVLELPFDISDDKLNQKICPEIIDNIFDLSLQRIRDRKPVAYLVNKAWFCGFPFFVDERVLIPRSPLAELIEERFVPWLDHTGVNRILDIGTGSGCIAITSAMSLPGATVDAIDMSNDALDVARINVQTYSLEDRVNLIKSNLYENLETKKYDLIISNPPYVNTLEMTSLPEEYKHEPGMGLAAGEDGLDVIHKIINGSKQYMSEKGILIVEVGNSQADLENTFPDLPFTWLEFERGGDGVFLLSADAL